MTIYPKNISGSNSLAYICSHLGEESQDYYNIVTFPDDGNDKIVWDLEDVDAYYEEDSTAIY